MAQTSLETGATTEIEAAGQLSHRPGPNHNRSVASGGASGHQPRRAPLYFRVDDIRAAHQELSERGVHFTGAPHLIYTDDATGDTEWMVFFEDGEGNTLALMSRVPGLHSER